MQRRGKEAAPGWAGSGMRPESVRRVVSKAGDDNNKMYTFVSSEHAASVSDDVGSSMMMMRELRESAFAISTICFCAMDSRSSNV